MAMMRQHTWPTRLVVGALSALVVLPLLAVMTTHVFWHSRAPIAATWIVGLLVAIVVFRRRWAWVVSAVLVLLGLLASIASGERDFMVWFIGLAILLVSPPMMDYVRPAVVLGRRRQTPTGHTH